MPLPTKHGPRSRPNPRRASICVWRLRAAGAVAELKGLRERHSFARTRRKRCRPHTGPLHEARRQTMEHPKNSRALQNQVHLYLLLPLLEQHPIEVGLEHARLPIPGDFVDVQRYAPVTLVKVIESELVEIGHVFML